MEHVPQSGEDPGPILRRCIDAARAANAHLVLGGFPEQAPDGRAFNTCIHLQPDGTVAAAYRKIHLFDVDLADGTRMRESRSTAPGDRAVTTQTPFGALGLTVCYDMRFPLLYQTLADMGAVAIAVPSAFFKNSGKRIGTRCCGRGPSSASATSWRRRQHGDHGHRGRKSYGHGLVVDPWATSWRKSKTATASRWRTSIPSASRTCARNCRASPTDGPSRDRTRMTEPRSVAASPLLAVAALVVIFAGVKAAEQLMVPFLLAAFLATIAATPVFWLHAPPESAGGRGDCRRVLGLVGALLAVGALIAQSVAEFQPGCPPTRNA